MGIIQDLIRDGRLKLWRAYGSGSTHDWSDNNNSGVLTATRWEGRMQRFPGITSVETVADASSLQLSSQGSLIVCGDLRDAVGSGARRLLSKRDAGGTNYELRITNAPRVELNTGASFTILNTSINGNSYLAVNIQAATVYIDGLLAGNLSGPTTIAANDAPLKIGNYYANSANAEFPFSDVLIVNPELTASEHAQLYGELCGSVWPTKYYSFAKRRQIANPAESGIVAGWDMKNVSGQLVDVTTAHTGTIEGGPTGRRPILGDSLLFNGITSYASIPAGWEVSMNSTNEFTFSGWIKPYSMAADQRVFQSDGGDNITLYITATGAMQVFLETTGTPWTSASSAVGVVPTDNWTHFLITYRDSVFKAYANGVEVISSAIWSGDLTMDPEPLVIGSRKTLSGNFFDGEICALKVLDTFSSINTARRDYLQGAKAIQFKTDWAYQVSPTSEGGVLHQVIGGNASPFRAGDTSGRWAVETDTIDGRLCKVLTCKTAGDLYVDSAYFFDCAAVEALYGTFRGWLYKPDAAKLTWKLGGTDFDATANGYGVVWAADESVVLSELGVGNVIGGGTATADIWHQFDTTRAFNNTFTSYVDATSFGTGTDATIATSVGMTFSMEAGCKLALSNIQGDQSLVKRLGVVAP